MAKPHSFLTLLSIVLLFALPAFAEENRKPTVGMTGTIEQIVLPGAELQPIPLTDDKTPIVLRILDVFPHGEGQLRYDLEFYGLDPGKYNLADYLQRKDGSAAEGLPEIAVEVMQQLPEGQILPKPLETNPLPFVGGYTMMLIVAGVIWLLVLLIMLFAGRKKSSDEEDAANREPTLAEKLRPMVRRAASGEELDKGEQAQLERLLLSFWRKRLDLEDAEPGAAMAEIRNHSEAGELLHALEDWLHRPPGSVDADVDIETLLEPYKNLNDDIIATS